MSKSTTPYITNIMLHPSARRATNWYDSNLLAGNLKKYQTINIGYRQVSDCRTCNLREQNSRNSLLDVHIDSKLNVTDYISSICKKASQGIGVLMRL